jgi:hypothetical protein
MRDVKKLKDYGVSVSDDLKIGDPVKTSRGHGTLIALHEDGLLLVEFPGLLGHTGKSWKIKIGSKGTRRNCWRFNAYDVKKFVHINLSGRI